MLKSLMRGGNALAGVQVLEALRANVMVADANLNITYLNSAVTALLT